MGSLSISFKSNRHRRLLWILSTFLTIGIWTILNHNSQLKSTHNIDVEYKSSYNTSSIDNSNNIDINFKNSNSVINYLKKTKEIHSSLNPTRIIQTKDELTPDYLKDIQLIDFDHRNIKYIPNEIINGIYEKIDLSTVNWSKFAYVLYATSIDYICNAGIIFNQLTILKTNAKFVLIVDEIFLNNPIEFPIENKLLLKLSQKFKIKLKPVKLSTYSNQLNPIKNIASNNQNEDQVDSKNWKASITKLLIFNETDYDRIIYLDNDAVLPNSNLDELFFLPPANIAIPPNYLNFEKAINSDNYAQLIKEKYNPENIGYIPLTVDEKTVKWEKFKQEFINPFLNNNHSNQYLPINGDFKELSFIEKANQVNFYRNIYNHLPSFNQIDESHLTTSLMVIEPSLEIWKRVELAMKLRTKGQFDMDLVEKYIAPLKDILYVYFLDHFKYPLIDDAILNKPEVLLLPHQTYGVFTQEFNSRLNHESYFAEPIDQLYYKANLSTSTGEPAYFELDKYIDRKQQASFIYKQMKYIKFNDYPIPKPWFKLDPEADYMSYRLGCTDHPNFKEINNGKHIVEPKLITDDCSTVLILEKIYEAFKQNRLDICELDLIEPSTTKAASVSTATTPST
ncbi:hypothetical protein WICMUC_003136 [Wickerhamomyces mucosus]|uniref:Glycosyltransferase family 8 protein n=1 Tax=Wickerhamomyces mucosus TaxID=1378264 RepID=A0A9P8PN70_9ASCO|nr:hypothetical protein WICMUC_003136 [Wickerhamomyces mucosus]